MTLLPADFRAEYSAQLCDALENSEPITSIRLNPQKQYNHSFSDGVDWCEDGFYLPSRPIFTLDPAFAAGAYYVQEASSMFLGWVVERLDLPENPTVLDLCAAPGGKSTHLSSIIGSRGVVVANETINARAGILAQNIQKWGVGNTVVTSIDAAVFGKAGAMFDLMVIDAPCSGEGMFRKDVDARAQWSLESIEKCAARQRRIVAQAWDALHQGGYLVYSTCTFNGSENEQNAEWIAQELGAEVIEFASLPAGVALNPAAGYNFYPHQVRGEGLYLVVLRKTGSGPGSALRGGGSAKGQKPPKMSDRYTVDPLVTVELNGSLYGYSAQMWRVVERLRSARVFMLYSGVELGVEIRGELKPAHSLALYCGLRRDLFAAADLPLDQALDYLRKGGVVSSYFAEGLNLVCFDGLPLGFAKRIDRRVNNGYPSSWRIANL